MGGNLALAAALQAPDDVAALALLATPWDFHAGGAHHAALVQSLAPALVPEQGQVPADEPAMLEESGRASGRDMVVQDVLALVVAGYLKKRTTHEIVIVPIETN